MYEFHALNFQDLDIQIREKRNHDAVLQYLLSFAVITALVLLFLATSGRMSRSDGSLKFRLTSDVILTSGAKDGRYR